jgi:hypothetical protein
MLRERASMSRLCVHGLSSRYYCRKGSKPFQSSMVIIGLRVPTRNLRGFSVFHVSPSFKNCPSSMRAIATDSVCIDFDVFRKQTIILSRI